MRNNIWNTPAPSLRWPVKLAVIENRHRDLRRQVILVQSPEMRADIDAHKARRARECAKVEPAMEWVR